MKCWCCMHVCRYCVVSTHSTPAKALGLTIMDNNHSNPKHASITKCWTVKIEKLFPITIFFFNTIHFQKEIYKIITQDK